MSFGIAIGSKEVIVVLTFLLASCAVKETTVQSQSSQNSHQSVLTAQKSSDGIPSNPDETDYFAHLHPNHRDVLQEWLKTKKYLRPAVEEIDNEMFHEKNYQDKKNYQEDFEANMKMLRESVGENGYQYYSVGDMNRDREEDFAVLLVDTREQKEGVDHFVLAIFNAPFRKGQSPSYYEEKLSGITNSYIVFDKMIEKHLFLGKFESDVYCATYYPKGKTYYFKDCFDE